MNLDEAVNKIHCADALAFLHQLPNESIDLIATDPPYGLQFMGKDWDKAVPSVEVWRECLRVLKSGAFAFIMCIPRLDCLSKMAQNLQSAGFDIGFTPVYWAYASGFPKSENISLMVDKQECARQLTEKLGRPPTKEEFKEAWKAFRKVIFVKKKLHISTPSTNEGWQRPSHYDENGQPKRIMEVLSPTTDDAKNLEGSYGGFQPKPAVEVIIVAMKPLSEKTYVDQALTNKKGVTWLDDGRIPLEPYSYSKGPGGTHGNGLIYGTAKDEMRNKPYESHPKGRFPANLLVSDDALNDGQEHGGQGHFNKKLTKMGETLFQGGWKDIERSADIQLKDKGSFSRYFDLDHWFEERLKKLPFEVQRTFPFLVVSKASKAERDKGCENLEKKRCGMMEDDNYPIKTGSGTLRNTQRRNVHPTVKPLKLMSYLITLGSRERDIVLDPFVGTGTTCVAAKMLGRRFIGVDIEAEYCRIAEERLKSVTQTTLLEMLE